MVDYAETYHAMKVLDGNLEWFGYSVMKAMEKAGQGIADHVTKRFGRQNKIAIFVGPGNKGGDGLAAARYLAQKNDVHVFLVAEQKTRESQTNLERIQKNKKIKIRHVKTQKDLPLQNVFDVYVDALVGLGLDGELRQPVRRVVTWLNQQQGKKVAVDVPTGHGGDTAFNADVVLSMHTPKVSGAVVVDIGIPKKLENYVGPGQVNALTLNRGAHKGENGVITVIGGSNQYHGAPRYAVEAAKSFCDLVYFYTPSKKSMFLEGMKTKSRAFSTLKKSQLHTAIQKSDCVLMGPGLEENAANKKLVNGILTRFPKKKFVLDAGAMMMADKKQFSSRACLTPHAGEFKRCFGLEASASNAKAMARKHQCVVLLKGKVDVITEGWKTFENVTGNAGMTRGGTGDVLAGLVTALSSQNDLFLSAQAAAFLNGLAGDWVARRQRMFSADDVARALPEAYEKALKK
ncbi:NAD(P)H-hydrate dehydratase [Candidatus Micrarchaeota archaeon]|nr:NAD(P)H-hydrate dehydratase [Candidatus Micrarchaeota archaeon]